MQILTSKQISMQLPAKEAGSKPEGTASGDILRRRADVILLDRPGNGAWVFAYGALIWDRPDANIGKCAGILHGMNRKSRPHDDGNRGTPGLPSPTPGTLRYRSAADPYMGRLATLIAARLGAA